MNSKDWKLSLLALAAITLLGACGDKKEDEDHSSPFTGIWVPAENVKSYARLKDDPRRFCSRVRKYQDRYGDANYRVQAVVVQNTGDVFQYFPGSDLNNASIRRRQILGRVDANGRYTAGMIGVDGNFVASSYSYREVGAYELTSDSSFQPNADGELTVIRASGNVRNYVRFDEATAKEYNLAVRRCLPDIIDEDTELTEEFGGHRRPEAPPRGHVEKDCDPAVDGKAACEIEPRKHGGQELPLGEEDQID